MLILNFEPFPVITTERLVLRRLTKDDVPAIFRLRSDERVAKYISRTIIQTMEEAEAFINRIENGVNNNESILWGITGKGENTVMGSVCLWNISKEHHRAEIGFEMHPDNWGKGIMKESLTAALDYGFNTIKLHSIEGVVNPDNTASIKLLERNHFVREAYFKENVYRKGKFADTAVYSLIANVI